MSNKTSNIALSTRPKSPQMFIGETQIHYAKQLKNIVSRFKNNEDSLTNRLLLSGKSGIGKTSLAYMYASLIVGISQNSPQWDNAIKVINCGSNTGIDNIRDNVIKRLRYKNMQFVYNIFIFEEFHGLSKDAQKALLTELESAPDFNIFIATTTEKDKILPELLSRFKEYSLLPPTIEDFRSKQEALITLAIKENKISKETSVSYTEDILDDIIYKSNDNVRTFDTLMEKLFEGSYISEELSSKEDKLELKNIIYKKYTLQEIIKLLKTTTSVETLHVALCKYAIKVLSSKDDTNCKNILLIFGEGLNKNASSDISFITKIIQYYNLN